MNRDKHPGSESEERQGSEYDRLFYPFLFEGGKVNADEVVAQVRQSTIEKAREIVALRRATLARCAEEVVTVGQAMARAFSAGATLFAFGNGGSTTDAQDIVTDLLNPPVVGQVAYPALALTSDIAVVTAVANDVGFVNVFARQIIALGRRGDIAFGISTSGNSANVLAALEQAKKQELITIGLAGYDGGKMQRSPYVDFCLVAESDHIPRIQEVQATLYHALFEVIQASVRMSGFGRDEPVRSAK